MSNNFYQQDTPQSFGETILPTVTTDTNAYYYDVSNIPAGVTSIKILLSNIIKTEGTALLLQLGTLGGVVTSAYYADCFVVLVNDTLGLSLNSPNGFPIAEHFSNIQGVVTLEKGNSQMWYMTASTLNGQVNKCVSQGTVTLTSDITKIRLTTIGAIDTFSDGSITVKCS